MSVAPLPAHDGRIDTGAVSSAKDGEGLCFTAGLRGPPFAAGVIHAYLATGRKAPVVVAGISAGAISAAVIGRVYQDLRDAVGSGRPEDLERARWSFLQRYLGVLGAEPFRCIWDALPDVEDFFAAYPTLPDPATREEDRPSEAESLRRKARLVRAAQFSARAPLTVSLLADLVTRKVMRAEAPRVSSRASLGLFLTVARALTHVVSFIAVNPTFLREQTKAGAPRRFPLLGWPIWTTAAALSSGAVLLSWASLVALAARLFALPWRWLPDGHALAVLAAAWAVSVLAAAAFTCLELWPHLQASRKVGRGLWSALTKYLLVRVGLQESILHDWPLLRQLSILDDPSPCARAPAGPPRTIGDLPFKVLIVAAPLEVVRRKAGSPLPAYQVWAQPHVSLVGAVRAAVAAVPVFAPIRGARADWGPAPDPGDPATGDQVTLVDGVAIRQNPLPALFNYLDTPEGRATAAGLRDGSPAGLHVVYSVPTAPQTSPGLPDAHADIVSVGLAATSLVKRRDTELEIELTNFITDVEQVVGRGVTRPGDRPAPSDVVPVHADAIAPREDLTFANPLAPSHEQLLAQVAHGCRATLERLHAVEIASVGQPEVPCRALMARIPSAQAIGAGKRSLPGLGEVCRACTGVLSVAPARPRADGPRHVSPHLADEERPRIVFVASGGVFRGAFHIGMLGALRGCGIRPDLVVGASVGTLMGGVLARLSQEDDTRWPHTLRELTGLFLHVDRKIALTHPLRTAASMLAIRSARIRVSPAMLRAAVARGTRRDPGYAATGVPPLLFDALRDLFLFSRQTTIGVTGPFLRGNVARSAQQFLGGLRRDSLRRLGIQDAVMGTSLLGPEARRILGDPSGAPDRRQPFSHHPLHPLSFYGTTVDLGPRELTLLGDDAVLPGTAYDFVEAALASSAFPCVFAPRRQSELYPGAGATDVRYADGGMFDNLPFIPAIKVLQRAQLQMFAASPVGSALADVTRRYRAPDLILVGALDVNPESEGVQATYLSLADIQARASSLDANTKIRAFELSSTKVDGQLKRLTSLTSIRPADEPFVAGIVSAAVLPVFPRARDYLNGTFAFSRSTGLDPQRVARSIANGCFETLLTLAGSRDEGGDDVRSRALRAQRKAGRLPQVTLRSAPQQGTQTSGCPYFLVDGSERECPFRREAGQAPDPTIADGRRIFDACARDDGQRAVVQQLVASRGVDASREAAE